MQPLTAEERTRIPGYGGHARVAMAVCFYSLPAFGLIGSWLASRLLAANTSLADSTVFAIIKFLAPSVDILANRCAAPKLAAFVYGAQWLLAPCYLALLFAMAPPWSNTTRAVARYTTKIRKVSLGKKVFIVLTTLFLVAYYLGDFRLIPFPTFLNGGLSPDNDPTWWLAEIYRSYLALAAYGAIVVAGECVFFWGMFLFIFNFDIIVLGRGADARSSSTAHPDRFH